MKKITASATLAAALVAGSGAAVVFGPGLATAQDDPGSTAPAETDAGSEPGATGGADATPDAADGERLAPPWLTEVFDGLVADGTLTRAQADAVVAALRDARPDRVGAGHGPFGGHRGDRGLRDHAGGGPFGGRGHALVEGLEVAADTIGIEVDELRAALSDGQSLAEVAEANGVERSALVDALVARAEERLDTAVAAGRLDADAAADMLERVTERIEALVDRSRP